MCSRLPSVATSSLVVLVALGRAALAQVSPPSPEDKVDTTARARQEFVEGQHHYDVGDYAQAIELWKRAYLDYADPILLFNIGQAQRLAGDCKSALVTYERYDNVSPSVANRTELDEAKAKCRAALAAATSPPPSKPDARPAPPPDAGSGMQSGLDAQPPPAAEVAAVTMPPPPPPNHSNLRPAGLVVGLAGVVLVGTSILAGQLAAGDASTVTAATQWSASLQSTQSAGKLDSVVAIATAAAGGAAIAAGIAMYVLGREHHVQVAVTPSSAGVTWNTAF
jgi:hypothetical protein